MYSKVIVLGLLAFQCLASTKSAALSKRDIGLNAPLIGGISLNNPIVSHSLPINTIGTYGSLKPTTSLGYTNNAIATVGRDVELISGPNVVGTPAVTGYSPTIANPGILYGGFIGSDLHPPIINQGLYGTAYGSPFFGQGLYGTGYGSPIFGQGSYGSALTTPILNQGLYGSALTTPILNQGLYGSALTTPILNQGLYGTGFNTPIINHGLYGTGLSSRIINPGLYGGGYPYLGDGIGHSTIL